MEYTESIHNMCRICCNNSRYNNSSPQTHRSADADDCLNNDEHQQQQMFHIFETQFKGILLVDLMRSCCPRLAIYFGNNLPKNICNYCKDLLIKFYEFQLLCIETDIKLRQSIKDEFRKGGPSSSSQQTFGIQFDNNNKCSGTENEIKQELNHYNLVAGAAAAASADNKQDKNCIKVIHEENIFVEQLENIHGDEKNVIKIKEDNNDDSALMAVLINENLYLENDFKLKMDKRFECDICKFRFNSIHSIKKHLNRHIQKYTAARNDKPKSVCYKCNKCTKKFNKQLSLSSHMRIHKNIGKKCNEYVCDICSKTFPKLNLLKSHIKIHKTLRKCTICDVWFISAQKLMAHMKMHRREITSSFVCPICQRSYKYSSTLKVHLLSHDSQKSYLCAKCGKSFDTNSNLHQHSIVHKDVKPFACSECPKQFKFKAKLTSHMATHSGLRPYVCDICYSTFTAAYSLKIHKRIHTGERPYSCQMCNMRFNSTGQLQCHIRTHTGEKPYKCKYCERGFAQSYDLVKHTRSHIGDKTYQCTQCTAAFRLQSELRAHVAMHYQEEQKFGAISNNKQK